MSNKSNRTMMRPLGVYLIGICKYILVVINFLMISGDFGGFFKMLTDIRTDGRTDRPSYRDARTHLKKPRINSHPIIHYPTSEGVSEVSEQANK